MAIRAPLHIQRYTQVGSLATRSLFHSTAFAPSSASTSNGTPDSPEQAPQARHDTGSETRSVPTPVDPREQRRAMAEARRQEIWKSRFSLATARQLLFGESTKPPLPDQSRSEKPKTESVPSEKGNAGRLKPIAIAKSASREATGRFPRRWLKSAGQAQKAEAAGQPGEGSSSLDKPESREEVNGTANKRIAAAGSFGKTVAPSHSFKGAEPRYGLKHVTKHNRIPKKSVRSASVAVGEAVSGEPDTSAASDEGAGEKVFVREPVPHLPPARRKPAHTKGADKKRHDSSNHLKKSNRIPNRLERRERPLVEKDTSDGPPVDIDTSTGTRLTEREIEEILRATADTPPPNNGSVLMEGTIEAQGVVMEEVEPLREMKVASLRTTLDRVLFNPGVHVLRDPRTGAWNFDKSIEDIPTPEQFAFHRCPQYIPPSQDKELLALAEKNKSQFIGSTSTLTKALSQIYFAISGGKGVSLSLLSQDYAHERTTFTPGAELPAFIDIKKVNEHCYSVDSVKTWDIPNVISEFGNILEKLLTAETEDFKRFLTESPESGVPESERNLKEAYRYQKINSLLMRSQLDCHDPRLPGSGVFDIKTRACLPIRHDRANYLENAAYDIAFEKGLENSYEREYYDLLRATMLKYSFQVRIGGMDGIFLAYHNTSRVFGFQYVPLTEIDKQIFGSSLMADQAFKISVVLLEDILARCVRLHDGDDISVTIKHSPSVEQNCVTAFVEPQGKTSHHGGARPVTAITYTLENYLDGERVEGPVEATNDDAPNHWMVKYTVSSSAGDRIATRRARSDLDQLVNRMTRMARLSVPQGETVESMTLRDEAALREAKEKGEAVPGAQRVMWATAGKRQLEMRKLARETGKAYEKRKSMWAERGKGKKGRGRLPETKAGAAKVKKCETEEEGTAESTPSETHTPN